MDIYILISIFRYPQRYPYATFRYLHVDILFKMCISIHRYLGFICGAQGAHHWGSPAPDRQWPGTNPPVVIWRCGNRPGTDRTLSWSCYGGRTGKKINVSCVQARAPNSVFPQHRAREWGHWGPSEHSLMDTRGIPSSILWWIPWTSPSCPGL